MIRNCHFKFLNLAVFLGSVNVFYITSIHGIGVLKSFENATNTNATIMTPPDWSLHIWEVIFGTQLLFVLTQFIDHESCSMNQYVYNMEYFYVSANIFNIIWLISYLFATPISFIIATIASFITGYLLVVLERRTLPFSVNRTWYELIFGSIPNMLFQGWTFIQFIITLTQTVGAWEEIQGENIFGMIMSILLMIMFIFYLFIGSNYILIIVFLYYVITLYTKNTDNEIFGPALMVVCVCSIFLLILKSALDCCRLRRIRKERQQIIYTEEADPVIIYSDYSSSV